MLAAELRELGAAVSLTLNRAVAFEGPKSLLYSSVNYRSRLALSVLVPVAAFSIKSQKDLLVDNGAVSVDWNQYLDTGSTLCCDGRCQLPAIFTDSRSCCPGGEGCHCRLLPQSWLLARPLCRT
ncbi:MAG: THUMP domain-containing protein [Bacteroidales bacterium]|nr:THUMP domain-containing protein [Bacteroidales bacterium]